MAEPKTTATAAAAQAGTAEEAAKGDMDRLRGDLERLRKDMEGLTRTVRDVASARGEEGAARAREMVEQAQAQARATLDTTERTVKENPLVSVAVAFGVGWVVGRLMDR